MLAKRRVLVTGATGFIGSHLAHHLLRAGAELHVLARPMASMRRLEGIRASVRMWSGDVTDYDSLLACCRSANPEFIFHLAADTSVRHFNGQWQTIGNSASINLLGSLAMLRAAIESHAPVAAFVRVGGLEEYGVGAVPYDETQREQPVSPYSASQVATTHYFQVLQQYTTMSIVTLRPALIYGPDQSMDFFIPSLIASCLQNVDFEMTAGDQTRDLLYVDDFIAALLAASTGVGLAGNIVNIGSGIEYAICDVANEIVRLTGTRANVSRSTGPVRVGDLRRLVAATRRAAVLLDWRPTIALTDGLERTIRWYSEQKERSQ